MAGGAGVKGQDPDPGSGRQAADAAAPGLAERRLRLRWRARRGLLENDIVLGRFLDVHQDLLGEEEVAGLERLLDCGDKELFELIRGHGEPGQGLDDPATRRVLAMLRQH